MAITETIARFDRSRFRLSARDVRRGLLAGVAWGLALTLGLAALTAASCGAICLPEVGVNAALSIASGILGIGPIAACGRRYRNR